MLYACFNADTDADYFNAYADANFSCRMIFLYCNMVIINWYRLFVVIDDYIGGVCRTRPQNRSPVLQQEWQDKDPSRLRVYVCRT